MTQNEPLLRIQNLSTYYHTPQGTIKAVDNVTLEIPTGTTLGLAGESGCGKTTLALSILNLIPYITHTPKTSQVPITDSNSKAEIAQGQILYKGTNLLKLTQTEMRKYRGQEIAMIFQNPITAMNPLETIGYQTGEPLQAHQKTKREKIQQLVQEYLGKVELKDPQKRINQDPHKFSGGEAQRIMLAMAIITAPSLLIADEPLKSLDVIVQRQIIQILKQMREEYALSMLLATHDLAVIAELSDHVATMYAGKILEHSNTISIYKDPRHPYTRGLLASIPRVQIKREIHGLPGEPPNPYSHIPGCKFHPRCTHAIDKCRHEEPQLIEVKPGHLTACFLAEQLPEWHN
jgi:peptide/nickel transport system ATP-binding protein